MKLIFNRLIISILVITATFSSIGNANEDDWITTLGNVLQGKAPFSELFSSKPKKVETYELTPFSNLPLPKVPFYKLPKEVQNAIIAYVSTVLDSSDIIKSAQAINALAKVDKALNIKINDPKFTEAIIANFYTKFLGQKFRLPVGLGYDALIFRKGKEFSIDEGELGKIAIALLLNTQGSWEWLKKSKIFLGWVNKAIQEESDRNFDIINR